VKIKRPPSLQAGFGTNRGKLQMARQLTLLYLNGGFGNVMEQTLVLVKPDGVQRGLAGEVISRLERRGLKLVAMKLMRMEESLAKQHYSEHVERPFFLGLVSFITSGPIVAMAWQGENSISLARQTMGATNPVDSAPGTIRGDLGVNIGRNIVHGSDGPESARRELNLFFQPEEILDYERSTDSWITEP
jgi:nucleoside-diphosphate kinase